MNEVPAEFLDMTENIMNSPIAEKVDHLMPIQPYRNFTYDFTNLF